MYNEADTRAKLIDPAIPACGWTEDLIKREETAGAIEIAGGTARRDLLGGLPDGGRSADLVRTLRAMDAYDLYDVLAELGYGLDPRTRQERAEAFGYKNRDWLSSMPPETAAAVGAIAAQFAQGGVEELENPRIFEISGVRNAGGLNALKAVGRPADVLAQTKERLFVG